MCDFYEISVNFSAKCSAEFFVPEGVPNVGRMGFPRSCNRQRAEMFSILQCTFEILQLKNKFRMVKMQKMFSKYPDVVSIKELTVMLNVSKNTAYELLKSGKLKSIKIGKQYRIPKQFVIEYLSGG